MTHNLGTVSLLVFTIFLRCLGKLPLNAVVPLMGVSFRKCVSCVRRGFLSVPRFCAR